MIYSNNIYYLQLAREYPKTLLRPSNVFTIDNPDILVLNDCGLWGIFIPTKAELEDIALLIRRATASRLAYSAQMKTVLVAVADINPIFREAINSTFAKYCMPDDNICDVIGEAVDNDRCAIISSVMRQRFAIRLYDIEEYSIKSSNMLYQRFQKLEFPNGEAIKVEPWDETLKQRDVRDLYSFENLGLFGNKTIKKGKFKDSLENLMTYSFYKDVTVNNGEMKILKEWGVEPVVLNINTEPFSITQLQKRSLMFQGIIPVSVDKTELVPQIFEELCSIRRRRNH